MSPEPVLQKAEPEGEPHVGQTESILLGQADRRRVVGVDEPDLVLVLHLAGRHGHRQPLTLECGPADELRPERDHLGVRLLRGARQPEAVADVIGEILDVGLLVVVRQDDGVALFL